MTRYSLFAVPVLIGVGVLSAQQSAARRNPLDSIGPCAATSTTCRYLWHFQTGSTMAASPMSYAVGGRQFVAISAGNTLYAFALREPSP